MLGIFFVGGTVAEAIAFTWQPIGAGNGASFKRSYIVANVLRHR